MSYGYTGHVMDFPGTINTDFEHFMHHVLDITKSLAYHGFKKIILLNGHGSNMPNLDLVARRTNLETDAECVSPSWWNLLTVDKDFLPAWRQSKFPGGCAHACELETSLYLYLDGDNVRKDQIKNGTITFNEEESPFNWVDLLRRRAGDGHLVDEQLLRDGRPRRGRAGDGGEGRARLRGGGEAARPVRDLVQGPAQGRATRPAPQTADDADAVGAALGDNAGRRGGDMSVTDPSAIPAEDIFDVPAGFVDRLFRLDGRVACVTGAANGIGAAIAKGLAQAGARVVVADLDDDGASRTVATVEQQGGQAMAVHCDVVRRASVDDLARTLVDELGRVDILVNSAGTAFRCPAEDFPEERLDAILALNIKGTYLPCQAIGRHMLAQGSGSIVNLASIGGFAAFPHASAYVASKGGVVQLTRVLAVEWTARGVRVNGIAPSRCDSPLTRTLATQSSVTSDFIDGRMLTDTLLLPRDLVGTAVFLASEASGRVSGHIVAVDDGYLAA